MKHNLKNTEHFTLQRDGADIINLDTGVVTSVGVSGNDLTWSLGNVPQTPITVPYATSADSVNSNVISTTYGQLKNLRDNSQLKPGVWYRITDYTCNATDIDIFVAGANLDILVCADDASHLNENARAAHHSGDTHYNNSRVESWLLKYTIDGDVSNPKGIVYWVKDENGREYGDSYINDIITNQEIYYMWAQYIPFYVEDVSGSENTLSIVKTAIPAPKLTVEMSTDGINWETMGVTSTAGITATIPANGRLYLRCDADAWGNLDYRNRILTSGNCNVGGNIMSLLNKTSFAKANTLNTEYTFDNLFYNNTKIIDASHLVLPATTLTNYCYQSMFEHCTSLTTAPTTLPATTLASHCYDYMFGGCTALTTAPELPATTLANSCYCFMFTGCTALTTAPALPATTLANSCYSSMFSYCESLTTAPALPATTLAYCCYLVMFNGCTSLTTAPALPATTLAEQCYNGMFENCTSLTTAPTTLPATTLASSCYSTMFYGCSGLTTAPALPATTLADNCYRNMFQYCPNLNYIKAMFTTTPSNTYTQNWVSGVASTGTFVKNSAATWDVTGTNGVPSGWTVQTAAS